MNILITGGTGFIGRAVFEQLVLRKYTVYATLRTREHTPSIAGVEWIEWDMTKTVQKNFPQKIDTIIHLAQSEKYRDFPDSARDIIDVNVNSTFELLEYAYKQGVKKFIFASTGSVYGAASSKMFTESEAVLPIGHLSFYAKSKYISEILLESYSKYFETLCMRIFFPYGKGQQLERFLPRIIANIRNNEPVALDGEQGLIFNPIHINDIVDFILRALQNSNTSGVFNIAGPQNISIRAIADIIASKVSANPIFNIKESKQKHFIGDISLVQKSFGFKPTICFIDKIEELLADKQ